MGLFSRKPKVVKEIRDGVWGHLVSDHHLDVDTLSNDVRCVEHEGEVVGQGQVTLLRVFRLSEAAHRGIAVTGWETFDQHPELMLFEGYLTRSNKAYLDRKTS